MLPPPTTGGEGLTAPQHAQVTGMETGVPGGGRGPHRAVGLGDTVHLGDHPAAAPIFGRGVGGCETTAGGWGRWKREGKAFPGWG